MATNSKQSEEIFEDGFGILGQCAYTMSNNKRCTQNAKVSVVFGPKWVDESKLKCYGFCHEHYFMITKPRDPRIHRTAELLTIDPEPAPDTSRQLGDDLGYC